MIKLYYHFFSSFSYELSFIIDDSFISVLRFFGLGTGKEY